MNDHPADPLETPVADLTDVGVTLSRRPILREVDLTVRQGEVVALLGANGSGKSTLVKAMVGLNPVSHGQVRLFGNPLSGFKDWSRLGYVPQRSTLTEGVPVTVWEVVASGRLSRRTPFVPLRQRDRTAITAALDAVGLTDRVRHQMSTLSGGQQQRVLVARTLAGEPDLLVLDEPNAGVDHQSQQAIADTLAGLSRRGATIVVVLHELGPFEPLIERTVLLREGRIVHDGPPSTLHDHPADVFAVGDGHHHAHDDVAQPPTVASLRAPLEGDR